MTDDRRAEWRCASVCYCWGQPGYHWFRGLAYALSKLVLAGTGLVVSSRDGLFAFCLVSSHQG